MLAACGQIQLDAISFVSPYYLKEAVLNTWTGEMTGFRVVGNFNKVNDGERVYIPHPDLRRTSRGRRKRPVASETIWTSLKLVEQPDNVCYARLMGIG